MTIQSASAATDGFVPPVEQRHKLQIAREHAEIARVDLARDLGVSRNTVTNYETGKVTPRRPVVIAWALRTGVSVSWLLGTDGGWAPRGSNPEPAGSVVDLLEAMRNRTHRKPPGYVSALVGAA